MVWCDLKKKILMDVFWCDLGVICFRMIWCDITEVRLGQSSFVFGVVWCLMVWFDVIFTFVGGHQCFCDLGVICF